jgi:hypothetical protein
MTYGGQEYAWMVNFTFPDGQVNSADAWDTDIIMWSSANNAETGVPIGGTTYFDITGAMNSDGRCVGRRVRKGGERQVQTIHILERERREGGLR